MCCVSLLVVAGIVRCWLLVLLAVWRCRRCCLVAVEVACFVWRAFACSLCVFDRCVLLLAVVVCGLVVVVVCWVVCCCLFVCCVAFVASGVYRCCCCSVCSTLLLKLFVVVIDVVCDKCKRKCGYLLRFASVVW